MERKITGMVFRYHPPLQKNPCSVSPALIAGIAKQDEVRLEPTAPTPTPAISFSSSARARAHPSARCTTQPPEALDEGLTSPFCIELQGFMTAPVRWRVELEFNCCHQVVGVFPQGSADWVHAMRKRPKDRRERGKGLAPHYLSPLESA